MVCIFSSVLQDFKKGQREIKRERKKEREKKAPSPSYYMWIFSGTALCVCTWRGSMYKQEHQQSDNKFLWGLWTLNSFLHRSHGRCSPCRFCCYSQLMLNNCSCWMWPQFGGWMCRLPCKLQSLHLWMYLILFGSCEACRSCRMHEYPAVKSADRKTTNSKCSSSLFSLHRFRAFSAPSLQFNQVECECGGFYQ